jgi:hypothetical protein
MFSVMRDRIITTTGMRSKSIEDLAQHYESDSIESPSESDSIESPSESDIDSVSSKASSSNDSNVSFFDKIGLRKRRASSISSIDLCDYDPKQSVIKVLKVIKQINATTKINLIPFLEMIQMYYYKHVSLSLLKTFMEQHKIIPKPIHFHYYVFFLHYAEFYHYTRSTIDIIDSNKVEFHNECLINIRKQIKYVYKILNKQNLNITEVSL